MMAIRSVGILAPQAGSGPAAVGLVISLMITGLCTCLQATNIHQGGKTKKVVLQQKFLLKITSVPSIMLERSEQ